MSERRLEQPLLYPPVDSIASGDSGPVLVTVLRLENLGEALRWLKDRGLITEQGYDLLSPWGRKP